tara:strand:+ start:907 stop:1146 length:240 start_codon:yes stop_codon:yes gene_type:complete
MSEDNTYNGWKNHATWSVALWINNDERLYRIALLCKDYAEFRECMELQGSTNTPDKVAWNDSGLDIEALDEMITENKGE